MENVAAIKHLECLLDDQGGVTEPSVFRQRVSDLDDEDLKKVLNSLDSLLWASRQITGLFHG